MTPLIWVKNLLDHEQILLVKSQEHMNVQEDQINLKNGSLKQPLWKQAFIEILLLTLIALAFEPLLNLLGMSMVYLTNRLIPCII